MNPETLAAQNTPFYIYDLSGFKKRVQQFKAAMPKGAKIHYALKANHFSGFLKVLVEEGCGIDVVSSGEMELALRAGFKPEQIVFSGVGKTHDELRAAIAAGISQINVESAPELARIIKLAGEPERPVGPGKQIGPNSPVRVALRVNPDVKTETHPYIQTGFRDNKFGLDFTEVPDLLAQLKNTQHVQLVGLTLHIGSQIRDIKPFEIAIQKALDLYASIEAQGFALESFDVGGGIGIDYAHQDITKDEELIKSYGALLDQLVPKKIKSLILEPGRILVARFGRLVTKVQYVKRTPFKNFIIVDAGMNHLIRPALYEAFHHIELARKSTAQKEMFDVVGPICESSDVLGYDRYLPGDIQEGDMLTVYDAGAYGAVMMSDYNLRPRAEEFSDESLAKIIFEET